MMLELDFLTFNLFELNFFTIFFRMFLAVFVGGIIGMERDVKHRAAGLRTHMLVCMGAAIVMMTNEYVAITYPDIDIDLTRMGAQVVSGIGFIGAGTILVTTENQIKGLTTAAGLWAAATLGLAIGIGFYEIAIIGTLAIIAIVVLLRPVKQFIQERTRDLEVHLVVHSENGMTAFIKATNRLDVRIATIDLETDLMSKEKENDSELIFSTTISLGKQADKDEVIEAIRSAKGIIEVTETDY